MKTSKKAESESASGGEQGPWGNPGVFLLLGLIFLFNLVTPSAHGAGYWVEREVYLPQKFDLGIAAGMGISGTSYTLAEAFAGYQVLRCGTHCFSYIDGAFRALAQYGESDYQTSLGWRFQKYMDESSWGPYLRPFIANNHYLFHGIVKDTGLAGLAVGTYFFLHPGADLRVEAGHGMGPTSWSFVSVGVSFKLHNI